MVATEAGGMIHKTVVSFVLIVGLWIFELRADENQAAGVDQSSGITVWIKQLNAPNYADRKEAFLKLCDPSLDIEAWVKNRDITDDPQLASTLGWLQRIRSLPGSIDARLARQRIKQLAKACKPIASRGVWLPENIFGNHPSLDICEITRGPVASMARTLVADDRAIVIRMTHSRLAPPTFLATPLTK